MKITLFIFRSLVLCAALAASLPSLAEQDSIILDENGDYVFTYKSYLGWQKVKWIPATKINPQIKSDVRPTTINLDHINYRYTVRNDKDSRQYIRVIRLSASNVLSPDPQQPAGWSGDVTLDRAAGSGFNVGWAFFSRGGPWQVGIKPGHSQNGFGFDSRDLPGVGKVATYGARLGGQSFPDEGPNEDDNPTIIKEFDRIINHDYVTRLTAVPRIQVPDPFNAATVLINLQTHLSDELVPMKLVEPVFAERFGRLLQAAIDAAQGGNTPGLQSHLKDLRNMLKGFGEPAEENHKAKDDESLDDQINTKAWPHPVAKLAARVLDFNLAYVEKRVKDKTRP